MAMTPGSGGGGNTDICWVSPSDLIGNAGNILARLKTLEERVARLKSANLNFGKVSDVAKGTGPLRDFDLLTGEGWPGDGQYTGTVITSGDASYGIDPGGQNIPADRRFAVAVLEDGTVIWGWRAIGSIDGLSAMGETAIYLTDLKVGEGYYKWTTLRNADFADNKSDLIEITKDGYYLMTIRLMASRAGTAVTFANAEFNIPESFFLNNAIEQSILIPDSFPAGTSLYWGQTTVVLLPARRPIAGWLTNHTGGTITSQAYMTLTQWAG